MAFDLSEYRTVAERITEFRDKYPEGSLQPLNRQHTYTVETIGDKTFIVYAAAAYRNAQDERPGVGVAWEPFPGHTPYTKDSELQNAETSAWGRAIIAVLASDTKKGIASAEEVRNRQDQHVSEQAIAQPRGAADVEGAGTTGNGQPAPSPISEKQVRLVQYKAKDASLSDDERHALIRLVTHDRTGSANALYGKEVDVLLRGFEAAKAGTVIFRGEGAEMVAEKQS